MVFCGRDFTCGGCMDVDNKNVKANDGRNAPLDASGQLTQPMRKDVQNMIKT
jgi:copper chaperone CopZ